MFFSSFGLFPPSHHTHQDSWWLYDFFYIYYRCLFGSSRTMASVNCANTLVSILGYLYIYREREFHEVPCRFRAYTYESISNMYSIHRSILDCVYIKSISMYLYINIQWRAAAGERSTPPRPRHHLLHTKSTFDIFYISSAGLPQETLWAPITV